MIGPLLKRGRRGSADVIFAPAIDADRNSNLFVCLGECVANSLLDLLVLSREGCQSLLISTAPYLAHTQTSWLCVRFAQTCTPNNRICYV